MRANILHILDGGAVEPSADALAARFTLDVAPLAEQLRRAAWRFANQPSDAEDLLQETLLRAWRAYDSFEAGSNFYAWLYRIMVNTWISRYRAAKRRPVERLVDDHDDANVVHSETSADSCVLDRLPAPEVHRAMQSLPESQRIVVYYAYVEGRRHKDISALVGIPVGTVMSRLHRARSRLRECLGDFAIEHGYGVTALACETSGAA